MDLAADSHATAAAAVYDEMVTGTGQVRAHWQPLMSRLSPIDPAMLEERGDEAAQLVRQQGVTYAVYGDRVGAERPWPLELIPLVISSEEWQTIEAGILQRVRLLNTILADIYGPGELVRSGKLPSALLHANPGFLRPCARRPPRASPMRNTNSRCVCWKVEDCRRISPRPPGGSNAQPRSAWPQRSIGLARCTRRALA